MTLRYGDRVLETSTTTGTGAFSLAGAVTGYQRFSAIPSIATSDTVYYSIFAVDANGNPSGDWETGLGTYSAANTLTRTTVQASSNSGSAVSFAAGTKYVMATPIASVFGTITEWAPNFTSDGDVYIPAAVAMTIDQGNAKIGTGTITFEKSTAAAPDTFSSTTLPATLEAGAWLHVNAASVSGFCATHLVRTA